MRAAGLGNAAARTFCRFAATHQVAPFIDARDDRYRWGDEPVVMRSSDMDDTIVLASMCER